MNLFIEIAYCTNALHDLSAIAEPLLANVMGLITFVTTDNKIHPVAWNKRFYASVCSSNSMQSTECVLAMEFRPISLSVCLSGWHTHSIVSKRLLYINRISFSSLWKWVVTPSSEKMVTLPLMPTKNGQLAATTKQSLTSCAWGRHNMHPPRTWPWPLTFRPWKWYRELHVTWATSVPVLVFLGLSVLDLGPMNATDVRQTDVRRASSLNAPSAWA